MTVNDLGKEKEKENKRNRKQFENDQFHCVLRLGKPVIDKIFPPMHKWDFDS